MIVVYCSVLLCIALYYCITVLLLWELCIICVLLLCIVLYYCVLYFIIAYGLVLLCSGLYYCVLLCITVYWFVLLCLVCITMYCSVFLFIALSSCVLLFIASGKLGVYDSVAGKGITSHMGARRWSNQTYLTVKFMSL